MIITYLGHIHLGILGVCLLLLSFSLLLIQLCENAYHAYSFLFLLCLLFNFAFVCLEVFYCCCFFYYYFIVAEFVGFFLCCYFVFACKLRVNYKIVLEARTALFSPGFQDIRIFMPP